VKKERKKLQATKFLEIRGIIYISGNFRRRILGERLEYLT